jgi:peptidoglycan/LPS O-acetylase OafA/YrhL
LSSRFITNLLVLLAGGFVVVSSQSFSAHTTGWIAFGVALGVLGMIAASQNRRRGNSQRALDAITGLLAIWSVVASVVFDASALTWLSFGDALGLAGLAIIGLCTHELSTERVVHRFAIPEHDGETAMKAAERYSAAA